MKRIIGRNYGNIIIAKNKNIRSTFDPGLPPIQQHVMSEITPKSSL